MFLWISRVKEEVSIKFAVSCGPTTSGLCPTPSRRSKDLIEEAAKVDLQPKPASLWWTSTYASEEKEDMILGTSKKNKFPFEDEFKILGCMMNRQGKTCDAEERMQSANKSLLENIKIYRSKDIPWRKKCQ